MTPSRPRLQVVQNDEIADAIAVIRKHRPGLINDSMVVTSALVEYALALKSNKTHQLSNYKTPYGMTILRTGESPNNVGILKFLIENFKYIAGIIAHIGSKDDDFTYYISRGKRLAYTFVLKGKGFTDFEFIHVATNGSLFEECLTLLALDFKNIRDDIRFHVIHTESFENRWAGKSIGNYIPSLEEMATIFFQDKNYSFGSSAKESYNILNLNWEANITSNKVIDIKDTRYVDYSHALIGLKESSFGKEKNGIVNLIRSGVLTVDRDSLHRRFRCMCNEWIEEQLDLDLYELGLIFANHFGLDATFSSATLLDEITLNHQPNAFVYVENDKRIEVLPMDWNHDSWFSYYIDGKSNLDGWCLLCTDPNPFKLYDMNDFYPKALEKYRQSKKKPKQQ